jgi:hypothetical protein
LVVEEVTDQRSISTKVIRVGWWLEDDDRPIITDEQRSATEDMRGSTSAMNAGG